jgi:hypothetical protein
MVKYYCDCCEKEYDFNDLKISSFQFVLPTNYWGKDNKPQGKQLKLCEGCTLKVKELLKKLNPEINLLK